LIEPEAWNRQLEVQQVEMNCIADFADRMKSLPQRRPSVSRDAS
jgi:hypothetical protein